MVFFLEIKNKFEFWFFVFVFLTFQPQNVGSMNNSFPDTNFQSEQDGPTLSFLEDLEAFYGSTLFKSFKNIFACDEASVAEAKNVFFDSFRRSEKCELLKLQRFLAMFDGGFLPEENHILVFNNSKARSFCDFLKIFLEFLCSENRKKLEETDLFESFLAAARRARRSSSSGVNSLEAFARRTRSRDFSEDEFELLKNFLSEMISLPASVSLEITKYYGIATLAEAPYSMLLSSVERIMGKIARRQLGEVVSVSSACSLVAGDIIDGTGPSAVDVLNTPAPSQEAPSGENGFDNQSAVGVAEIASFDSAPVILEEANETVASSSSSSDSETNLLEFFVAQGFNLENFLKSSLFSSFRQAFSTSCEAQQEARRVFCFNSLLKCKKSDLSQLNAFLTVLEVDGADQITNKFDLLPVRSVDAELFYKKLKMVLLELLTEDARSAQSNNFLQKVRELLGSFQQRQFEQTDLFNTFRLAAEAQVNAREKIMSFLFEKKDHLTSDIRWFLDYLDMLVNSFSRASCERPSHLALFAMTFPYGLTCSEEAEAAYEALFLKVRSDFFFKKDEKEFIRQPTAKFKDFLRIAASNGNFSGSASDRIQKFDLSKCSEVDLEQLKFFLGKIIVDSLNQTSDVHREESNIITEGYGLLSFERARGAYEILLDRVTGQLFLNNEFGSFMKTPLFRRFQEAAKVQLERIASTIIRIESFNIDGDSDDELKQLGCFLSKLILARYEKPSHDLSYQITRACGITSFDKAGDAYIELLRRIGSKFEPLWKKMVWPAAKLTGAVALGLLGWKFGPSIPEKYKQQMKDQALALARDFIIRITTLPKQIKGPKEGSF